MPRGSVGHRGVYLHRYSVSNIVHGNTASRTTNRETGILLHKDDIHTIHNAQYTCATKQYGCRKRGDGDASPAVEKSAGDIPPEIMIFQQLFSRHIKFLNNPTLSK